MGTGIHTNTNTNTGTGTGTRTATRTTPPTAMRTRTGMITPTVRPPTGIRMRDATRSLLPLLRLASPALPIGGFSYSEGLEAAVAHGWVHDAQSAAAWLGDQLRLNQARGDLSAVAQLIAAWRAHDEARITTLAQWIHETRESTELRLQTEQMGRSLLIWLKQSQWATPEQIAWCERLRPSHPLVMALALSCTTASLQEALETYAFSWAENLVQAALKSIPLGQSAGQQVLQTLCAQIPQAVADALAREDDERLVFAPMLAILSSRHESQYSRLFRS